MLTPEGHYFATMTMLDQHAGWGVDGAAVRMYTGFDFLIITF